MSREKRTRKAERDYLTALHQLIDELYEIAWVDKGWSWHELARQSGVSTSTIVRLGNRETRFPEFRSVWLIAKAVGQAEHLTCLKRLKRKAVA